MGLSYIKKSEIIKLAEQSKKRPSSKTKLGACLANYVNKSSSSYDDDFDNRIRTLRPDWFWEK